MGARAPTRQTDANSSLPTPLPPLDTTVGADDGQQAAEHELAATISAELEALREGGQPLTDGGRKEAEIVETSTAKATPTPGAPPQRDNGLLGDGEWFGLEEEDIEAAMEDMDAQLNQMFSSMRVQEQ